MRVFEGRKTHLRFPWLVRFWNAAKKELLH